MSDGGEPTARRIAHETQVRDGHKSLGLGQHAGSVRVEVAAQAKFLAGQHDRGAVIADRAADQYTIAGAHLIETESDPARAEADSGGGEVDPVAFAAADHFRIAGDDRDAACCAPPCRVHRSRGAAGQSPDPLRGIRSRS